VSGDATVAEWDWMQFFWKMHAATMDSWGVDKENLP